MTADQETVLMIRGSIASLPDEDQKKVNQVVSRILMLEIEFGTQALQFAVALIGSELAAKED